MRQSAKGFSLVEVVTAIGIVAFAMLAIIGVLPTGIQMVQESLVQQARASITNQLRSKLQQIPFSTDSNTPAFSIGDLSSAEYYYTREGIEIDQTSTSFNQDAYYVITFDPQKKEVGDIDTEVPSDIPADKIPGAYNVKVTMRYPYGAPVDNQKQLQFSLFAARQRNF
ncbi:MAG: Verru_Chthon cassette protein B [Verrucomicrobiales bacterium]|jgi:uncharacterized protein (TIGR02598 family)|nr:Verru_Chthon cassette protein B [Verrucomicrobiales bacterium]